MQFIINLIYDCRIVYYTLSISSISNLLYNSLHRRLISFPITRQETAILYFILFNLIHILGPYRSSCDSPIFPFPVLQSFSSVSILNTECPRGPINYSRCIDILLIRCSFSHQYICDMLLYNQQIGLSAFIRHNGSIFG